MMDEYRDIFSQINDLRAEFTEWDFVIALLILDSENMGRYSLQKELNLSESSTKSLLIFGKRASLVKSVLGRSGHSLTSKGKEFVNFIKKFMVEYGEFQQKIFDENNHYYVVLKFENKQEVNSWKIRDQAIKLGGKAILVLLTTNDERLDFPEKEMKLQDYYPELALSPEKYIKTELQEKMMILIVGAKNQNDARKSAIISSLMLIPKLQSLFYT